MEKPSGEFFASLGQYVYQYIDADGKPYYTGKGNGDRCWAHVADKGFNPEECYVVARNLEKFEDKKDWQSFLLESYLISTQNPDGNSVSGHYKECFIMQPLSTVFTEYQVDQYDMFSEFPSWYTENYDVFRNRLRDVKINASSFFLLSNARNKTYIMFWWVPNTDDKVKITFEFNAKDEELKSLMNGIKTWLKNSGYTKTHADGKETKMAVFVDTIDEAVDMFKNFWI